MPLTQADLSAARDSILETQREWAEWSREHDLDFDPSPEPDDEDVRMRALIMVVTAGELHRLSTPELEHVLARDREAQDELRGERNAVNVVGKLKERCRTLEREIARRAEDPGRGFQLDRRLYLTCERCAWETVVQDPRDVAGLSAQHKKDAHGSL